jgi:hypothetical protein
MNKISFLCTFGTDWTLELDLQAYIPCTTGHISFIYSRLNYHKVQDQTLLPWHKFWVLPKWAYNTVCFKFNWDLVRLSIFSSLFISLLTQSPFNDFWHTSTLLWFMVLQPIDHNRVFAFNLYVLIVFVLHWNTCFVPIFTFYYYSGLCIGWEWCVQTIVWLSSLLLHCFCKA